MSRYVLSSGLGLIQSLMPVGEAAIASCSSTRVAACIVPPRECFMSFFQRSCASSATLNDRSSPAVNLSNLRDNSKATKKRIRVGRGNSSRRGNYCGRGQNGHNARTGGGPHLLYDGGQLGLLKYPVTRERPPFEVLYTQLGLSKLMEYIQLGLLQHDRVITMKDLQDIGCVSRIKYGVILYGKVPVHFPIHIQVSACNDDTKASIEAAGGSVTRVYYEEEGLRALLHPGTYTKKNLPLPYPAHSWHPKFDGKFDAIGQITPEKRIPSSPAK